MTDEVLNFIEKRWVANKDIFLNGNCYWFARILKDRFDYLDIYYLPIEGHFVACDEENHKMYDANGSFRYNEKAIPLEKIKTNDENWYKRLVRDCIY